VGADFRTARPVPTILGPCVRYFMATRRDDVEARNAMDGDIAGARE
jgi:hypothetical protein